MDFLRGQDQQKIEEEFKRAIESSSIEIFKVTQHQNILMEQWDTMLNNSL